MDNVTFTISAQTVAEIALLNDDIGYLLDTDFSEEATEELRETQERLSVLLDRIEAGRNAKGAAQ
ncbi:hypothetical protein [Massiliimalia timonensis]|uniref:hypothetical protein n=1 Tax=Massiliimalia timonensis TaxID=1987501 RepID=UPI00189D7BF8|nr:hypothetical protein [Massiliimalia timonensis]